MSSYIVLARKWRPQTFADLVGQQHVAVTLRNAIMQNRVAHAFLFTGSRGVGKTSSARIFAKALNCEHAPCEEPCNKCRSCIEITEGHSLDVIEIDGASNRGINEIREVLDAVRYAPSRDRYKIYIIDEVHMLTTEAFNALLKTLEEPPPHVIFIFATTDPNKIPITIVSRCQRYDFKRISNDDLVAHLRHIADEEHIEFEDSALRLIARTARGGVRDALSAMDQIIAFAEQPISGERAAEVLGVASRETLMNMTEAILQRNVPCALACIERVEHYGQNLSLFAFDLLEFLRDVAVMASGCGCDVPVELSSYEKDIVKSWLGLVTGDRIQRIFKIWYDTSEMLPKSLSPRLLMEMAAIRMCQVETVIPLDGILRKLDAISRGLSSQLNIAPDALEHVREYLKMPASESGDEKKKPESGRNGRSLNGPAPESGQPPKSPAPDPATPDAGKSNPAQPPDNKPNPVQTRGNNPNPVQTREDKPNKVPAAQETDVHAETSSGSRTGGAIYNDTPPRASDAPPDLDDMPWPDETEIAAQTAQNGDAGWIAEAEDDDSDLDADGDDALITQKDEKLLAVSQDRLKNARFDGGAENAHAKMLYAWKQIVRTLNAPLSTILSKAKVDSYSPIHVDITLPLVYKDIVTRAHIEDVERQLSRANGQTCDIRVSYDEIGDDSETLAAMEARKELEIQQQAFEKTKSDPIFKDICGIFGVGDDAIRFTFNKDRTSS